MTNEEVKKEFRKYNKMLDERFVGFLDPYLYIVNIEETQTVGEAIERRLTENGFEWSKVFMTSKYIIEIDGIPTTYEYDGLIKDGRDPANKKWLIRLLKI